MIDIDIKGLPLPADAPKAGACIELERPEAGLVILRLVPPHRTLAVFDLPLMRDLAVTLNALSEEEGLKGLVITGRTPDSFAAGADIEAIGSVTDEELVGRTVRMGQAVFESIHILSTRRKARVRTVAAVGGPVPGGAFEISLACSRIIAADLPSTKLGLPETQLGILPAWGGCTRLPRRIGVPGSLDAILAGKLLPAKAALKRGWIDRVVPAERLIELASEIAMGRLKSKRRPRGFVGKWLVDRNPLAAMILEKGAIKQVEAKTKGHYPAPVEAAKVVAWSCLRSRAKSLEAEAVTASSLAIGSICKSLVGVFQMMESAKKLGKSEEGESPTALSQGAVLGAGVMGGAIASLMAEKGVATRLFDIAPEGLDAAVIKHRKDLAKKKKRRRIERHQHDGAIDRLTTSAELIGFQGSEVVIEAVAERLDVKHDVLGKLAAICSEDTILATNTSSLSVDDIAAPLSNPERVVGMHFFNPVKMMPLVEIVRGRHTSDEVVTKIAALSLRMGKTPVVVKDVAGFLVNRLLGPYLDEAIRLYTAGVAPERLDRLAEEFGMPMGPLRLLDEVGLDIAGHAALSLHSAYGERMAPCTAIRPLLDAGCLGKKTGSGFYEHSKGAKGAPLVLNPKLASLAPAASTEGAELPDSVIVDHMTFAMLAEGLRALEENVTRTPDELDLATVFGMGFAPFRGGLLRWADSLGADKVMRRLESIRASRLVQARGAGAARFDTPELLALYAKEGRKFRP